MKEMIIAVIAALIGIMIISVSVYYLVKEINDKESKKIYIVSSLYRCSGYHWCID